MSSLVVANVAGVACGSRQAGDDNEILVFAAISLTNALEEVISGFEADDDVDILVSYGGSQALAQQISSGAPADVFLSAGAFPVDFLERKQVEVTDRVDLVSNRLVLVVDPDGPKVDHMPQLASDDIGRVALASPDLAPAGAYARDSLKNLGLWDELQHKMIFGADVRAAMAYVESGNADVALVYQTDASAAAGLKVVDIVPADSYPTIVYPGVLLKGGKNPISGARFLKYLQGEAASDIFAAHGFTPLLDGHNGG